MKIVIACAKCAKEIEGFVDDRTEPSMVKLLQRLSQRVLCAQCHAIAEARKPVAPNRVEKSQPKEKL